MNAQSPSFFAKLVRKPSALREDGSDRLDPESAIAICKSFESLGLGGLWITDAQGSLTYLSHTVAEQLAPHGSQAGRSFFDLFDYAHTEVTGHRNLRTAFTRRSRFDRLISQSQSADGQIKWWSISGEATAGTGGEFNGFIGFCTDITNDRRLAEENSRLAMHDPLTGLLNRREMTNRLERTLSACKAQERTCAIMLIDLDRFKQVNDTLGHSTGDALLCQVAERLVTMVGSPEKVCRLGGDEFQVMLIDKDDRGDLGELAERIIAMLSQPYTVEGSRCIIGASIGVAVSPFDGVDLDELNRNADLALYAAKHGGRGRFRFFARELLEAAAERRALEEDLHDALSQGEIELLYQPVVHAQTNRVVGAEALIRWNHPEKGLVSPVTFIPIAEETSLICRIGEWVLRKSCEDAAKWPANLRVAVNVSPIQFTDPNFVTQVATALAATGLDPDRLELEITEGVFLANGAGTDAIFQALKSLGVRLSLDDFGTGYSSLAYLKSAPFDKIKIDQSFVRGATEAGSRNKVIIAAIVSMAEAFNMETTAEGIETFDQLDMIRAKGVSHVQGYIYAKPIPNEEFVSSAQQADWGIEPSGYAMQRHERISMYRKIGAIHQDHYYTVMLRNLSASGALIEGLLDVPIGTQFVLDFGDGQLEIATVGRSRGSQLGVRFESQLVDDGQGGLCTRARVSQYMLATAGMPDFAKMTGPSAIVGMQGDKVSLPAFMTVLERRPIVTMSTE